MDEKKPSSWYIPRPSLTLTKNHQDAIRRYHRDSEVIDIEKKPPKRNLSSAKFSSSSSSTISSHNSKDQQRQICMMETCIDANDEIKRGSRSSQGSSDSEQSIHVRTQRLQNNCKFS